MIKRVIFFVLVLFSIQSYSQKLVYKSNGNVRDSENNKISPDKVRELLANNEKLLADYDAGRSKKTAGNILLIGGIGLLIADLIHGVTASGISATPIGGGQYALQDEKNNYPSALTYIGVVAVVIAIPVKIGFSKKIRNVVSDYNNQKSVGFNEFKYQKIEFISNSNGLGLRLTLH